MFFFNMRPLKTRPNIEAEHLELILKLEKSSILSNYRKSCGFIKKDSQELLLRFYLDLTLIMLR